MDWIPVVILVGLFAANVPVAFSIAIAGLSFFMMVQGTMMEAFMLGSVTRVRRCHHSHCHSR